MVFLIKRCVQSTQYELQIWPVYSQGPSELKPLKNLGEKGAWAYPESETAQVFLSTPYRLLSQERVKNNRYKKLSYCCDSRSYCMQ